MEYRSYRGGDEDALVACWNHSLPRDQVTPTRFIATTLLDENFEEEGLIEAWDGEGRLCGFVHAVKERHRRVEDRRDGWICVLVVEPEWRRRGTGRALLERAHDFLRAGGCRRVQVSPYAPGYYYPGVPQDYREAAAMFEAVGYHPQVTVVAMDIRLTGYVMPTQVIDARERLERSGWKIGTVPPSRYVQLVRLAEEFSPDWGSSVRSALLRPGGHNQLVVAIKGSEVGGFALFGAYDEHAERFGPFGVHPTRRRLGLGTVLLHETLREMAARGLHGAWFLWTGENDDAGRLYQRAGFEVTRRFTIYQGDLAVLPSVEVAVSGSQEVSPS